MRATHTLLLKLAMKIWSWVDSKLFLGSTQQRDKYRSAAVSAESTQNLTVSDLTYLRLYWGCSQWNPESTQDGYPRMTQELFCINLASFRHCFLSSCENCELSLNKVWWWLLHDAETGTATTVTFVHLWELGNDGPTWQQLSQSLVVRWSAFGC